MLCVPSVLGTNSCRRHVRKMEKNVAWSNNAVTFQSRQVSDFAWCPQMPTPVIQHIAKTSSRDFRHFFLMTFQKWQGFALLDKNLRTTLTNASCILTLLQRVRNKTSFTKINTRMGNLYQICNITVPWVCEYLVGTLLMLLASRVKFVLASPRRPH